MEKHTKDHQKAASTGEREECSLGLSGLFWSFSVKWQYCFLLFRITVWLLTTTAQLDYFSKMPWFTKIKNLKITKSVRECHGEGFKMTTVTDLPLYHPCSHVLHSTIRTSGATSML